MYTPIYFFLCTSVGSFHSLLRCLVAEFTLAENPAMTTTSLLRTVCHKDDSILLGSWLQETDHKFVEEQVCKTSSRVFCLSLKVIWCCWVNKNSNICNVIYMCTVYLLVAFKNLIFFFFYSSFKPIVHQGLDLLNMIHHVYLNAALRYTCQTADIFMLFAKYYRQFLSIFVTSAFSWLKT